MLTRLLSKRSEDDLLVGYPDHKALHTDAANVVRLLYQHERHKDTAGGESMWDNAETFLDYLDTAAEVPPNNEPNPHADRITLILKRNNWSRISPQDLRHAARRLIAAECCAFLEGADTRREQWQPYRTWARFLTGSDTIISFNYDRVVEMLCDAQDRDASRGVGTPSPVMTLTPGRMDDPGVWRGCCPLLKLHGSVDWRRQAPVNGKIGFEVTQDPTFALLCNDEELAIASPGPSKKRAATEFKELWKLAEKALANADSIIFVGYRFPETDADARERLLGAIRENNGDQARPRVAPQHHLPIHVVVGGRPDHTKRLEALLRHVCRTNRVEGGPGNNLRTFQVHSHPLFAQDFFTVVNRDEL